MKEFDIGKVDATGYSFMRDFRDRPRRTKESDPEYARIVAKRRHKERLARKARKVTRECA